jgi:hypothetical protein
MTGAEHVFDPSYSQAEGRERCVMCGRTRSAPEHDIPRSQQIERARQHANLARGAVANVKRELRAGRITPSQALHTPGAGAATVVDLLAAAPGWSRDRARTLMNDLRISELKRVRELTAAQRQHITLRTNDRRAAA